MKSSRYYQNWLQIMARGSMAFLYIGGYFASKNSFIISFLFLLMNVISGYITSHFKYRRYEAIAEEFYRDVPKKLKSSRYYQKWLQICGRGKEVFVFFLGLLLGKSCWQFSVMLFVALLSFSFITSEFAYRREQAVLPERLKRNDNSEEVK